MEKPKQTGSESIVDKEKLKAEAKSAALKKVREAKVAVVNIDDLAEREARKAADAHMTESKDSSNFLKKLWKHTFFDEYYRQREVNRVREEIKSKGDIYAGRIDESQNGRRNKGSIYGLNGSGPDRTSHNNAMVAVSERFTSEYDGTITDGEEKKLLDNSSAEAINAKKEIKDLVTKYATSTMSEDAFIAEKGRLLHILKDQDLLKGAGAYADNLLEIAKNARLAIEHGATLQDLELDTDVIVGKAKSALKTEAHFNNVDKLVDSMKKSKIGRFLSPAVLSTATGLAYSATVGFGARFLRSKAAAIATFGGAVGVSSLLAGVNESQRLAQERKQHGLEMAEGQTYEEGSKRREQMEEYQYKMETAADLTKLLEQAVESGDSQKVMSMLSEIDARRSLNARKKVDLISYSSIGSVEKENTDLTILTAKAKVDIRNKVAAGLFAIPAGENLDSYLAKMTQTVEDSLLGGDAGLDAKDKAFRKYKIKRVAHKVGLTILTGLTIGAIAQEGVALVKDNVQGLIEGATGTGGAHVTTQTPLEHLRSWVAGHFTHTVDNPVTSSIDGHNFKIPEGTSLIKNTDGTFNILRGTDVVSSHVSLHFGANGALDHDSIVRLGQDGIVASNSGAMVNGTREVLVSGDQYVNNHPEKMTHVVRSWMDNDTPMYPDPDHPGHLLGADLNELRTHWGGVNGTGIDADGNYVLNIQHMTNDGSFHDGLTVEAVDEIKKGNMEVLFSVTKGTQEHVIKGTIGADGMIRIAKDSVEGKMLFANVGGHAQYNGAFIEIAKHNGDLTGGIEKMQVLSTHIGTDHAAALKEIVPTHVGSPVTNMDIPKDTEPPYFIPLVYRNPLEKTKNEEKEAAPLPVPPVPIEDIEDFSEDSREYYYSGGDGDFGLLDRKQYRKRMSKKILENKELDLSENDSAVVAEYLEKQDPEYLAELGNMISGEKPMSPDVETVITVPAYQEAGNFEKTLRAYAKLKDRNKFELVILENHPVSVERDNLAEIIGKIKLEFPDMNISHLYKAFDKKPAIGEVRKYLVDAVMLRKHQAKISKSLAIVSNDADMEDINPDYANKVSEVFKLNKKIDAIAAKWDFPEESFKKFPLLHASQRLWQYLDIAFRNNYLKSPELIGRNSAFRSGTYAAIGGYNEKAKLAEDLEIGWLIKEARGHEASRIEYANSAWLISNPRRAVVKMLSGGNLIEQYGDFHVNEEVRKAPLDKLLENKHDFSETEFGVQVQSIYNHYARWKKSAGGWVDDTYINQSFDRAMRFLGVKYKLEDGKVVVADSSRLLEGLQNYENGTPKKIVPSGVNVEKPELKNNDLAAESTPVSPEVKEEELTTEKLKNEMLAAFSSILKEQGDKAKIKDFRIDLNTNKIFADVELDAGWIGGPVSIQMVLGVENNNFVFAEKPKVKARSVALGAVNSAVIGVPSKIKEILELNRNGKISQLSMGDNKLLLKM
jgi:hypothetical protein